MTIFKKILAGITAAATMVSVGTTIFADDSDFRKSWSVNYIKGAPSSISKQIDEQYLFYYKGGYQTTCTSFNGNGDGYVSVQINYKQKWMITGTGTVPIGGWCNIEESDSDQLGRVYFHITAVGNRVKAGGTIHLYGYKS